MKIYNFIIPFILLTSCALHSQNISTVYLSKDDTTKNMFIAIMPNSGVDSVKSFMFLINGMGNPVRDVLQQTELPMKAASRGILVIIPLMETGVYSFGIDDSTQNSLKRIIDYCVEKYHLQSKPFYLGGYSIGGSCVVKYAELAIKNNYTVKPNAVFAVDPPLDFERHYNAAKRNIRLRTGHFDNSESEFIISKMEEYMKGSPQTELKNYYAISPYSYSDTAQEAVKLLNKTPVTLYSEPNISWWLHNRGYDYSDLNSIDCAAFINELNLLGNENARFVPTENKGVRKPQNQYHPHSWSIVDTDELLHWLSNFN